MSRRPDLLSSQNMTDSQDLFFSSGETVRDFRSVLRDVQEYISSKCAFNMP